jgi:hypothetical protein
MIIIGSVRKRCEELAKIPQIVITQFKLDDREIGGTDHVISQ